MRRYSWEVQKLNVILDDWKASSSSAHGLSRNQWIEACSLVQNGIGGVCYPGGMKYEQLRHFRECVEAYDSANTIDIDAIKWFWNALETSSPEGREHVVRNTLIHEEDWINCGMEVEAKLLFGPIKRRYPVLQ